MSRRYISIASAVVVLAALLAVSAGNRNASGSDVEFVWGNWRCVADPMSVDNATTLLRYAAGIEKPSTIGCSPIGEIVVDDIHGNLIWGDTDCDGAANAKDALAQFLWLAGLNEPEENCPELGDSLVELVSDWTVTSVDYDVPAGTSGAVVNGQGRVDVTIQAGNRGPAESGASLSMTVDIPSEQAAIRFIPQAGDLCFDLTPQQVTCSEGNPGSDPTVDLCLDETDNDGDQLEDFDDPDCQQVRTLRESILLAPGPNDGTYERSFTIFCTVDAQLTFDIDVRVEPVAGVDDPDLTNNTADRSITVDCGPAVGAQADWEVTSVEHDVPAGTSGDVISSQGRVDVTVQAGNRGPETSGAGLLFSIDLEASIAAIRWIPLAGDQCFYRDGNTSPCSEGNPGSDPTVDLCLDGNDNDGDQLEDFDDPDCNGFGRLLESIFLTPGPNDGTYERSFTIFCTVEGPISFDIHMTVEPTGDVDDPDLTNNAIDHTVDVDCVS